MLLARVLRCALCAARLRARGGFSLVDVMFAAALSLTLGAVAMPPLLAGIDDLRAAAAVHYVVTRLYRTRMEAVSRSSAVGWQFVRTTAGYGYSAYVDGNGNGIRSSEIERGIDGVVAPLEHLSDRFAGVDFGIQPGLPRVDAAGSAPITAPIELGASNILTFTSAGTSSSGSLYVRGRSNAQFVIRILGETGKVRVLKFDPRANRWRPV